MLRNFTRAQFERALNQLLGVPYPGGIDQKVYEQSVTQNYEIGSCMDIGPCRYRYGQAGAVAIALGVLCQAPVPDGNQHNLVPTASYAVGTLIITVTLGATAITANQYAGGWLAVMDGTGKGQVKKILSHPAAGSGAICAFTLAEPLTTATDGTSRMSLTQNPYTGTIIQPSPPTSKLVGVPVCGVTASYFAWFQTRGPASVLTDGVIYIHRAVAPSPTVDGAIRHAAQYITTGTSADPGAALTHSRASLDSAGAENANAAVCGAADPGASTEFDLGPQQTVVGTVMRVEADTKYSLIWLALE